MCYPFVGSYFHRNCEGTVPGREAMRMDAGIVRIFYGEGHGKSTAAMGRALQAASEGKSVFVIHYLKGRMEDEAQFMKKLEPEIKVFQFEKSDGSYENL